MTWAREHVDGDDLYLEWEARQYVAQREYAKAIAVLTRAARDTSVGTQAKAQLTRALVQTRMLAGHEAIVQARLQKSGNLEVEHALAVLHGDAAAIKKKRDALVEFAKARAAGGFRVGVDIVMRTIIAELPTGQPKDLTALNDVLNAIVDERDKGNPRIDLLRAFVAIKLQARELLVVLSTKRHQETKAVAQGGLHFLDKNYPAALHSFGQAAKAAGDGRFIVASSYFAALAAARAAQVETALHYCDEVIRPRLFEWSWGGYVGPCLLISAEASQPAEAKSFADRLVELRSAAGDNDVLLQSARRLSRP